MLVITKVLFKLFFIFKMSITIAVANQKGGVGKTTTAVNLATELALTGNRVVLLDLDPQGSATSGLRIDSTVLNKDLYDVFIEKANLSEILISTPIDKLEIIASARDLVSIEMELVEKAERELILNKELAKLNRSFVVIDCPPSSGLLTLNALGAADFLLVPLQAEYYALEGISSLMETVDFVRQTFNPSLKLLGVLMTMFDARTNLSAQVESEARNFFQKYMFDTKIPRSVKLSESPSHGKPIALYDSNSAGAKAYKVFTIELMEKISSHFEISKHMDSAQA
jgi:chromosome partitioning protein